MPLKRIELHFERLLVGLQQTYIYVRHGEFDTQFVGIHQRYNRSTRSNPLVILNQPLLDGSGKRSIQLRIPHVVRR